MIKKNPIFCGKILRVRKSEGEMKYVFIVLLFGVCVSVGYLFSMKFLKRKKFFSALIAFADKLSLEINFSRERLKILIENFDPHTKKQLLGVDEAFLNFLDRKADLDAEQVFKKATILKDDEKNCVLLFLKTLGRSDVENQTKEISTFVSRFSQYLDTCDAENKKFGTLSIKLGLVAGLFCAIILF